MYYGRKNERYYNYFHGFHFQFPPDTYDEIKNALEDFSEGAASMVLKLLETEPKLRLKSLRQIKIQPFFHGFDFEDVALKKVSYKTRKPIFVLSTIIFVGYYSCCLVCFQYDPNELLKKSSPEASRNDGRRLPSFEEFDD